MANLRKLWALKTSLRGIANTEGSPDMVVPDSFFWTIDPSTGFTPEYQYYTGGNYVDNAPSPFLWSVKNTFYEDSSLYTSYYGVVQEFDFTAWFRRTRSSGINPNYYIDYYRVLPSFDFQMLGKDPYYDVSYTSFDGNEIPSYFQKFFTGSMIQPLEDDDVFSSYATESKTVPVTQGFSTQTGLGYGWWYRNVYEQGASNLYLSYPNKREMARFSSTVPGTYSLAANYYIQTWQSDTAGVWNEYEGASLTPSPQIPYLDKFWYGGTISNAEKEQMPMKGKPRLVSPLGQDGDLSYSSPPLYEAGGTNIAYEIELALHRYGAEYFSTTQPVRVNYVAGNFTFSDMYYSQPGMCLIVPCYVTLEPNEDSIPSATDGNYYGSTSGYKSAQVRRGHLSRYVIVSIRLEQPFNAESYVVGSGITLDPERVSNTYPYADRLVSGFAGGNQNAYGVTTGALYPQSNHTDVVLNAGKVSGNYVSKAGPVNCFRMSESGDQWFWTGGTFTTFDSQPTNRIIFKANPGSYTPGNAYTTGPRNLLFLSNQADPYEGHQIYTSQWANTITPVVVHEQSSASYVDDSNRVDYTSLINNDLGFKIQAFQWSSCGEWLYVLYTSGAQPNTDSSSYVYQWVERYWSNSTLGEGYNINSSPLFDDDGDLEWAGSTDIHYIYGNGDVDYPTLYPAHSLNVTPDGQYLQLLFDYFADGHPTISEHFLGGDSNLIIPPAGASGVYAKYSGLSRSTNPRSYSGYSSVTTESLIRWPVVTVKPGYVGDNLTTAQIDAGQTEVYLRMGTAYYSIDDYNYAYQRRNSTGTSAQEEVKTWPTDFSWSSDGSCIYLFGFLNRTLYADQYPSGYSTRYGMWEMNENAPVMWKVKLYAQRADTNSQSTLPWYPGGNPNAYYYPNPEGHPYLYNNRIYWNWRHHNLNKSVGLETAGAPYYPNTDYRRRSVSMRLKKAAFDVTNGYPSGTGNTEYEVSPSYGAKEVFLTVSYNVFSRQDIAVVINSVDYLDAYDLSTRGIAFQYIFDLSDSSMSGDGINVYDSNGNVWTQGVTFNGTPGTSGAYMLIRLDPFAGSYPNTGLLWVYGSASSGPGDTNNPGFVIFPREVPKFHWVTTNLTDNGNSNTGSIWPEYPIRTKPSTRPVPVEWSYLKFSDDTKPAVFNLAKNGRFINVACTILEGNIDGSGSEVQRINTWVIESEADENKYAAENGGALGPNDYIGERYSSQSPVGPDTGRSRWGNSMHLAMAEDNFIYTPVYRETSVGYSAQQWKMRDRSSSYSGSNTDRLGMTEISFTEAGNSRLNGQVDFDWQGTGQEIALNGGNQHWPYVITESGDKDPLVLFNDTRGGFESLWFVAPQRTPISNYEGWVQSGLFYYGLGSRYTFYYEGPFQRRIPSLYQYYEDLVETGEFVDLSDVAVQSSVGLSSPGYSGTLQKYHLLNGTSITSNWRTGTSPQRRTDVPPFKFREKYPSREITSVSPTEHSVTYMDLIYSGYGSNYSVIKKKFNGPNMTQTAFAFENSGRAEMEIPYIFDSNAALNAEFPTTVRSLEYDGDLGFHSQAQVRSIRFVDGGKRFAVLLSGYLRKSDGFGYGYPAFTVFMYTTAEPYSINGATLDKSFTYSNAISNVAKRSWWQSFSNRSGTYYGGDFVIKPDGTKMWVLGIESTATGFPIRSYQSALILYEFDLATPFDLSTVSENGTATYANIADNGTGFELPDNLEVSPDGLTVYWGTHSPYTSDEAILHYKSELQNAYDLKNPLDESTRSVTYQGQQFNIVSKGDPMYAYEGAGQMMRFVGNNPDRWYRTNYANPAVGTETTPTNPATGTTVYKALLNQPLGGCSVFENEGRKYQKDATRLSVGNMGMFPTRPFVGDAGDNYSSLTYPFGTGRRSDVSKFDKFIFAIDPEETTMVVSDGQRWLYQLLFNNDRGVKGL